MIEELNSKYTEFKGVIDILPVNTKYNRKRKVDYITEEVEKDNKRLLDVKNEIEKRIKKFSSLESNNKIEALEKELEKCNILNEWNNYNTSYEKMHLDYYLYQLHRYYKENLDGVNACLKKIIESFKKVEITLKKEDFDYNNYVAEYMEKLLNNASSEELKACFEQIYWKNSDIIRIIEVNFKSIYLKYEKQINKYYETRHQEYLKKHSDSELYDLRVKISNNIAELKGKDEALNFQKFVNGEYSVNDFKEADIEKKKETYFKTESYSYDNLIELRNVLSEYHIIVKYKYLFTDMREKLEKKAELKNARATALKKVNGEVAKLMKLNAKQNKKGLFGKKKNDDKLLFQYKEVLNNIMTFYDEYDVASYNDLVFEKLNQDSTILEVLKLISSNYLYFVSKTLELDETRSIDEITEEFEELKNYVNTGSFKIINNVALLDEKQMKQLIIDKYNLGNITLTIDQLVDDSFDRTFGEIENLINYENIIVSGISIDDVSLYLEYNKIINK